MSHMKFALRSLAKSPFVTGVAVLSLALGIGANAAIFSLFDQMILSALPVREPGRLVNLSAPGPKEGMQSCGQAGPCDAVFSYPMFRDLERAPGGFSGLAAHRQFEANLAQGGETLNREELRALPAATSVSAALVPVLAGNNWGTSVAGEGFARTPEADTDALYNEVGEGYFATLGIPLLAGREFTAADGSGAAKVAIVNEAFARKFGLDPRQAVGKRMARDADDDAAMDVEIVGLVRDAKYSEVKDAVPALFFTPHRQDDGIGAMTFYVRTALDPGEAMRAVAALMKRLDPTLPVENLKTLDQQERGTALLAAVALGAGYLPARRASLVDPKEALRAD